MLIFLFSWILLILYLVNFLTWKVYIYKNCSPTFNLVSSIQTCSWATTHITVYRLLVQFFRSYGPFLLDCTFTNRLQTLRNVPCCFILLELNWLSFKKSYNDFVFVVYKAYCQYNSGNFDLLPWQRITARMLLHCMLNSNEKQVPP